MSNQVDRRKSTRRRTLKPGKIVFNNGQSTIDCVVRSQSAQGARLKMATVVGIPDQFELAIISDPPRTCSIVWRSATEIGVSFEIA